MHIMPQHTQRDISTATQAPSLQHRPWCEDHATADPNDPSGTGFCSRTVEVGQVGVELADEDEGTVILLWPGTDRRVTPEQAREIAAELIRAAETVEQADAESHRRPATSGGSAMIQGLLNAEPVTVATEPGEDEWEGFIITPETRQALLNYQTLPISVSVAEAVAMTSFSSYQIYTAISAGELKAVRLGQRLAIKVDELRQWVDTLEPV